MICLQISCLPKLSCRARFVPAGPLAGAWSIESTGLRYECSHANELRLANYSLFALFGLAAANEAVLTVLGLRGPPCQSCRMTLYPMLAFKPALLSVFVVVMGGLPCLACAGGPFETKKRRAMTPLLYAEVVIWGLLLGFTGGQHVCPAT